MKPLIEVRQLEKSFGERKALQGISFDAGGAYLVAVGEFAGNPGTLSGRGASPAVLRSGRGISLATVKTHVINIYSKLQVSNRVEAAEKARALGLL